MASAPLDNGVCETAPGNGICTLRAAIMKANHLAGGGVTIQLESLTYQLNIAKAYPDDETTGDLNITKSMSVVGRYASGTVIQGGGLSADRVFHVLAGSLTLRRVTIQNGNCGSGCEGSGLLVDSGSALALNNSTVMSNSNNYLGGGISNRGSLTLNYSAVSGNTNEGIFTSGETTLSNSTIDGNVGIGIFVDCSVCGTKRIYNSTVSNNTGGGVFNSGGPLIMINSTVFGNSSSGHGGGLLNGSAAPGATATTSLYNVTIAYNSAGQNQAGGGVYNAVGTVNFQNTIIASNVHQTPSSPFSASDDCGGTLTSSDYNLIADTTNCTIVGSISNNQIKQDANFGFFQDNGGATQTQALLAGSPAIDTGNAGGCADELGAPLTTDQRGAPRPVNGGTAVRCDIGAYEYLAKISQSIGFDALANKIIGDPPFSLTATASSGLAVTFTAAGPCSVAGSSLMLTGAGTCTVTAHQAGNSNYNAAPNVPRSFTIYASGSRLYLPVIVR